MATLKYWDAGSSQYVLLSGGVGPAGVGVPAGGTANQLLVKNSGTDYDTKWAPLQVPYVPPQTPPGSGKNFYTDAAGDVWASLNGSAWQRATQVIKARLYRNAAWTLTNGQTVPFDTYDYGGTWNLSNGTTFTVPVAGDYLVSSYLAANIPNANYMYFTVRRNAATTRTSTVAWNNTGAANNVYAFFTDVVQFNANDTSDIYSVNTFGSLAGGTGSSGTWVSYRFLSAL